jgi:DNA-binding Xre family transcriptional regulator
MTIRHMLDGLMQATKATSHTNLATKAGLDFTTISRMWAGKQIDVRMSTLQRVRDYTGIPLADLFGWFDLPEGALLGRIEEWQTE